MPQRATDAARRGQTGTVSREPPEAHRPVAAGRENRGVGEKKERTDNVGTPTVGSLPVRAAKKDTWVKSSLSFANGNCVEVADLAAGEIGVRNSRDSAGPVLRFTPDEWRAFIGGVHNGEFDGFGMS
jgi:ABC-type amino acid transport substrate-binding protein